MILRVWENMGLGLRLGWIVGIGVGFFQSNCECKVGGGRGNKSSQWFDLGVVVARPDLDGVARLDWRALFDGNDA